MWTPDAFTPPPPQGPYFLSASNAWVFSRYDDVFAVLCEPALSQTATASAGKHSRADASAAISHLNLNAMQPLIASSFLFALDTLESRREFDLVTDLIHPWSASLLTSVLGAGCKQARRLASLAQHVSGGPLEARTSLLRSSFKSTVRHSAEIAWRTLRKKRANQDLTRFCAESHLPGLKPVFLGITQTLAGFLANAWLALLHHPDAAEPLRADASLLPFAIDELLRYAGLVHTLIRHTSEEVQIAGVTIAPGQTLQLKIQSANRDPAYFHEPDRLILDRSAGRRELRHLALGGGPHACVAAQFVRIAATAATGVLMQKLAGITLAAPVEWSRGAVISFPTKLPVVR